MCIQGSDVGDNSERGYGGSRGGGAEGDLGFGEFFLPEGVFVGLGLLGDFAGVGLIFGPFGGVGGEGVVLFAVEHPADEVVVAAVVLEIGFVVVVPDNGRRRFERG